MPPLRLHQNNRTKICAKEGFFMRSDTFGPRARYGITCGVALLLTAYTTPTFAQEENEPQTVVVTGSRIRTDPLNEPAPLTTVTDADIAKSGTTSVGDVLQRLTTSGGGLNTKFNTSGNTGFPPDQGGVGAG